MRSYASRLVSSLVLSFPIPSPFLRQSITHGFMHNYTMHSTLSKLDEEDTRIQNDAVDNDNASMTDDEDMDSGKVSSSNDATNAVSID